MRINVISTALALGFVLIAGQAMAQRDQNSGGTPGTAPASAVSKPDATNPVNAAGNTNSNPTSGLPAPLQDTTNPTATNPNNPNNNPITNNPNATGSNLNNPATTTDRNANNPNPNTNATGPANTGGRAETGSESRTDRSGERGNRDDNQWRYRFYNGVWWYWLPENRWVYWSNGAWLDYNPVTVNYQYEYDQNGRPIRYRTGYRGYAAQNEQNRTGASNQATENRTDAGRREAGADNTRRDNEANRTDANRTDANRSERENKSDASSNRTEENSKSNSSDHSESKSGK
jgi:hypothetical protein